MQGQIGRVELARIYLLGLVYWVGFAESGLLDLVRLVGLNGWNLIGLFCQVRFALFSK